MNTLKDWLQFIKKSYTRCFTIILSILSTWYIAHFNEDANAIFITAMCILGVISIKFVHDKEITISKLQQRLADNNIEYKDILDDKEN